tara:strand:- start:120 stop:551 length:432 start_codon:yes stop_codon:yes gene_type:complete
MGNIDISWDTIEQQVKNASSYLETQNIDLLVGIIRGGLIPATMISHQTNIPMTTLDWQTRDGEFKDILKLDELRTQQFNIMFIDDICDTGATIHEIREQYPGARFSVLFTKTVDMGLDFEGIRLYNSSEYKRKQWINFPWEKK